jgi:2-oxoglutarate ferredoxin oxidoreductase subunit beta
MTAVDLGLPSPRGLAGVPTTDAKQTAKDYKSDQEVRWCPGCGDYVVLNAVQSFLPTLGLKRENIVFISGIGCSSRFPYYLNTYGMHSIHGRAPAIATGLAVARPDLSVWVVTGDGDALSIGGNHLIHALRRNVNIKILLFNNRIYGLTKGQYSPTSEEGKVTKSTPMGSLDHPFNPISLAVGAEATFVARTMDSDRAQLTEILTAAAQHRGSAFIEIYQNCPIFNDGAFDVLKEAGEHERRLIPLAAGQPIRFGPQGEFGVTRNGFAGLTVAEVADVGEEAVITHDPTITDPSYAFALSRLSTQDLSHVVTGIFRDVDRPAYDDEARAQLADARDRRPADLQSLLRGKDTWSVG